MKSAIALLCIALCVSAAAAADTTETSMYETLYGPQASAMAHKHKMEKASICFRDTAVCNRNQGSSSWTDFYTLEKMQCTACPGADNFPSPLVLEPTATFSNCVWDIRILNGNNRVTVADKPDFKYAGSYSGTCYLKEDGDCNFPETCEDTIVTVQGVLYSFEEAILLGPEFDNNLGTNCPNSFREIEPEQPAAKELETPAAKEPDTAGKAGIQSINQDQDRVPQGVPVYSGLAYIGTCTINAHHPLKYKSSCFHNYAELNRAGTLPLAQTLALPRFADRYTKFEFTGDGKKHY